MSSSATEHTEVVFETALAFLRSELSVLSELVGECSRISGGGRLAGVVTGVLIVLVLRFVRIAGVVAGVLVAGFLVGLVFVGLVLIGLVLLRAGLLAETLVVTGVDGMHESLHGFESGRLALLAHNVFDSFHQSGIVMVTEDGIIPAGTDHKTVEFDIVLHDALIILHLEIVNSVFCVGGRVNGTKLSPEGMDKGGPIVHPWRGFVRVEYSRLEVLQSSTMEEGQSEGHLRFIIVIGWIVAEIEVAQEDEVVELPGQVGKSHCSV